VVHQTNRRFLICWLCNDCVSGSATLKRTRTIYHVDGLRIVYYDDDAINTAILDHVGNVYDCGIV